MNKKLLFIPVIIALGVLIIFLFGRDKEVEVGNVEKIKKDLTIEYGSIVKISDYVDVTDGELIDKEIEYSDLGEIDVTYQVKKDDKLEEKNLKFNVVDTKGPSIIVNDVMKLEQGESGFLIDKMFMADNYDRTFKRNIDGIYNVSEVGEYPLIIKAEDSHGNKSEKSFTLKIIPKNSTSEETKTYFKDIVKKYKNDNTLIGIDVSKWQGDIDFKKVKESGVSFVIIRLGTQSDFGGKNVLDVKFKQNIKNAISNGLDVGIYFHSYATSLREADEQAKFVIDNLKNYNISFPVAFDWESWSSFNKLNLNLTELTNIQEEFLRKITEAGYTGIRYGSKNYLTYAWQDTRYLTWVAHYSDNQTDYKGDYVMWQQCSDGIVDGINGYVDIDIYYKNN